MNPPKRLERPNLRRTSLIWSDFKDDTKKAIWLSLRSDFALPDGFQWVLHDATMVDPGPPLLARWLIRLVSRLEYKKANNDSYIVVFAPTKGKQSRSDAMGQLDATEDDIFAGLDMSYSPPYNQMQQYPPETQEHHQQQYLPETHIPPRPSGPSPHAQAYIDERDPGDSQRYPESPAFTQAEPITWASKRMPPERIPPERIPLDRIPPDRMPADRKPPERMQLDPMPPDQTHMNRMPTERMGMPPDRIPSHRMPLPTPGLRMTMSLSDDARLGYECQDHIYSPVRRPSHALRRRRNDSLDSDRSRPVSRSKSYQSYDSVFLPPVPGGGRYGSEVDFPEVDFTHERRSEHDARDDLDRRARRAHVARSRRSRPLQSDDMESQDQFDSDDDELDDEQLYDQLLRKFTGHGVREHEAANEGSDEHVVEGGGHELDGDTAENGIGDANTHVGAGDTEIGTGDDADDEGIGRT